MSCYARRKKGGLVWRVCMSEMDLRDSFFLFFVGSDMNRDGLATMYKDFNYEIFLFVVSIILYLFTCCLRIIKGVLAFSFDFVRVRLIHRNRINAWVFCEQSLTDFSNGIKCMSGYLSESLIARTKILYCCGKINRQHSCTALEKHRYLSTATTLANSLRFRYHLYK